MTTAKGQSPCPHRPICPGCPLIEIPYDEQIRAKQSKLKSTFKDFESALLPFVASKHPFRYRNRAKMVVGHSGRWGLYQKKSHRLAHIPKCPIHMPRINQVIDGAMRQVQKRKISIYDEKNHTGFLRYIIARKSKIGNGVLLIFVTRSQAWPEGRKFARALRRNIPGLVGVIQNINPARGNVIEGPTNVLIEGQPFLNDQINQVRLHVSATPFLQGNHKMAEKLYQALTQQGRWTSEDCVWDLYSGMGVAGLHICSKVRNVIAIEENPEAVQCGIENKHINKQKNIFFVEGKVEEKMKTALRKFDPPNKVIVNPPRSGCSEKVLDQIAESGAQLIQYISCSPKSLARDLLYLGQNGYAVQSIQGFDLYPQTEHIECLATLQRTTPYDKKKRYGTAKKIQTKKHQKKGVRTKKVHQKGRKKNTRS